MKERFIKFVEWIGDKIDRGDERENGKSNIYKF